MKPLLFGATVAAMAALDVIAWPVAAVVIVGHWLATEARKGSALDEVGEALEDAE